MANLARSPAERLPLNRNRSKEVAFTASGAEPPERLIQVLSRTRHGRAGVGRGVDILGTAHSRVGHTTAREIMALYQGESLGPSSAGCSTCSELLMQGNSQ